jgi:carboxymethylenebutenolidase
MASEPISSKHIQLHATDGHTFEAYVARTQKIPEAAVVIIQEIFGVNAHIRSVVDEYASEGFLAIAPALFDRVEPNIELSYDPEGQQRGVQLRQQVGIDKPLLDLDAAIEYCAREVAPTAVGVVGYCWGGTLAWLSATRLKANAAVGYYAGRIGDYAKEIPHAPVMFHFGQRDKHIGPDQIEAVRSGHPEVQIYMYDADHAFNRDVGTAYNPDAASLAKARTIDFLKAKLLTH